MKVRYSYLSEQFEDSAAILDDIRRIVRRGDFTLGEEVARFETAFARMIGVRHAVGVASGTDALKLALKAAGVGPGDEVVTAANTFIATVGAIHELGARAVLADVTPYYTIDPERVEAAVTPRTRAILPVHITGEPADMDELQAIASRRGLSVVEDACQAIGASYRGKNVGSLGMAAGFSLHPLKNLNVWGDGGVIATDSDELDAHLRLLRNHGLRSRDEVAIMGYNSRLDTIQAAVGNRFLGKVAEINSKRIRNAAAYESAFSALSGAVRLPPARPGVTRVYHLFMIRVANRDGLLRFLIENGIEAKVHYPVPLHLQPGLAPLGYRAGAFPETERQSREVLTLPVDQHLSSEQVRYVIDTVKRFFEDGGARA
jgi:dTDP-4-amino-4,6-dideoxygalactose transaminase